MVVYSIECDGNKFGQGCAEECGNCVNDEQCHHINGDCGCERTNNPEQRYNLFSFLLKRTLLINVEYGLLKCYMYDDIKLNQNNYGN